MFFRQLFDSETSTYSYLLADTEAGEAVLVDPVLEQAQRDAELIRQLGFRLVATLETHVHADHVTGAWTLKQELGSEIVYPAASGVQEADRLLGAGDRVHFGRFSVEARPTPGHTDGCTTWVTGDRKMAFTGDALLIRGSGRTDFQQGDARTLFRSVWTEILSLPDDTLLYPGHDYKGRTVTTVAEEKLHNPRLGAAHSEEDFVATMAALKLPPPKHIGRALPANLRLGREPAWPRLRRSLSGAPQVDIDWVREHGQGVRLIDVRQPDEYHGPLGHVPGAELIPLETLGREANSWSREEPLVLICRSAGRSDMAASALERAGFTRVASMRGGMLAWQSAA